MFRKSVLICFMSALAVVLAGAMFVSSDGITPRPTKNSPLSSESAVEKTSIGARTAVIPTPVWVIGSYDKEGRPNMMTSSWVGICSSKPPALMTCLRKATYTHGNIMDKKAFTVNIASESLARYAAYVGRVSGRDTKKFKETGLTPVKSTLVEAPVYSRISPGRRVPGHRHRGGGLAYHVHRGNHGYQGRSVHPRQEGLSRNGKIETVCVFSRRFPVLRHRADSWHHRRPGQKRR